MGSTRPRVGAVTVNEASDRLRPDRGIETGGRHTARSADGITLARRSRERARKDGTTSDMRVIHRILGSRQDSELAHRLHHLAHLGAVDVLVVSSIDVARRRIRATTQAGEEIALALPRDEPLFDGAVLALDESHAIVARVGTERWLRLVPGSQAAALELGYHAGNLHWRVRFADGAILVALDGPADQYLARLGALVTDGPLTHTILDGAEAC